MSGEPFDSDYDDSGNVYDIESEEHDTDFEGEGPGEITSHAGTPLPGDLDFFIDPPEEIGEVRTQWSTLTTDQQPRSGIARLLITAGVCAAVIVASGLLFMMIDERAIGFMGGAVIGFFISLIVGPIAWFVTRFKAVCSYTGTRGVARFTLKGNRESEPKAEIFVFDDATDLTTASTHHYYNGVYTQTSYRYEWTDHNGQRMFLLNGSYRDKNGNPKPKDPFHLARAAEHFWTVYLLDILQQELEEHGSVEFRLDRKSLLRLEPGILEFEIKGRTDRVKAEDIKKLSINQGTFYIDTHEAKWFGSKGKFRFQYGTMANARAFLIALETLGGFRFD